MKENSLPEIDVVKLFGNAVAFLLRWKWVMLICISLEVVYSFYSFDQLSLKYKPFYKKDYIAKSDVVYNGVLMEIINSFNEFAKLEKAKKTKEFEVLNSSFKGLKLIHNEGTKAEYSSLKVTIESYDEFAIDTIVSNLLNFCNNIEIIKLNHKLLLEQKLKLLNLVNKQLAGLNGKYSDSLYILNTVTDKKSMERIQYVELYEKKLELERQITTNKTVEFLDLGNPAILINNNNTLIFRVVANGFIGVFLGVIASLCLHIYFKVRKPV